MPPSNASDWRPPAAYLYTLHLDGPSLAWEYLRRNPDYGCDWRRHQSDCGAGDSFRTAALRWGMRALEDPARDARDAHPQWVPDPLGLVQLCADVAPHADAVTFRLWNLTGHKCLEHDGRRLVLTCDHLGQTVRLAISPTLEDGMAYAYAVRAGPGLSRRWRAVEIDLTLLESTQPASCAVAKIRPNRTSILHMRTLQALDGVRAGASHRDIALALFGASTIKERWHEDGDLRAQVRRLIRSGRRLVDGAYRELLQIGPSSQGS